MTKEELKQEAEKYVKQNYCEICVMADDCKCGCIDCFTVQAYLASAEPREKRIAELEKQVKEWKALQEMFEGKSFKLEGEITNLHKQILKLEKENAELERKLEQTEKDLADYQFNYPTIKELQKENAELKKKNLDAQDAITMQMYTNKANKEIADKQLTKAKEIIRDFISVAIDYIDKEDKNYSYIVEAEQFLNSEVEK